MKCVVEVEPICPFINGKCIKDGWEYGSKILHPCAFYDAETLCTSDTAIEPCKIKRAVDKLLADETTDNPTESSCLVPWDTEEGGKHNGK